MSQLDLFPPPPLDTRADAALAARRPPHVLLGTSSWTFPGWAGLVYRGRPSQQQLVDRGLEEYARHPLFSTVSIDRSHYAPLSPAELARYRAQLPAGFPCVLKVWSAITTPGPQFFALDFFRDAVLGPIEAEFAEHAAVLLFQLPPLRPEALPTPNAFALTLSRFFARAPKRFRYAVEVRNSALLKPTYFDALAQHGVAHVFNHWERMPSVGEQLSLPKSLTGVDVVCRLLLPQGADYEQAREAFAPFDRLQAVDEAMRADTLALARACGESGRRLFVLVNNKAEGSSPLTVRALLERLAAPPA